MTSVPIRKLAMLWVRVRAAAGIDEPLFQDQPLSARTDIALLLCGCAMPLLMVALARFPTFVERAYTGTIGQFVSRKLTQITEPFPFSVVELAAGVMVIAAITRTTRAAIHIARHKRHVLNAVLCGILLSAKTAGILAISGYLCWGFNYARAGLVTREHWSSYATQTAAASQNQELIRYCTLLVALANREYEAAVGSKDAGHPSALHAGIPAVDAAIESAYIKIAERLDLPHWFAAHRGEAKPVFTSFLLSDLLIGGVYSPWTGEANYNRELPQYDIPQAIAHEKAHQRSITGEDEANFFGFLACIYSSDPYARYSGYAFAQVQLLAELRRRDPARAAELVSQRDRGIQRDIDADRAFVLRHLGLASTLQSAVNDAYLRVNRSPGGIETYNESARLIIIYARAVDATLSGSVR